MATSALARKWLTDRPYVAVCIAIVTLVLPALALSRSPEDKNAIPKLPSTIPDVTNT